MFHQNAIALTIGGMSFSMPIYPLVEGHTIDIQLPECIIDYLIHNDTVHEAFLIPRLDTCLGNISLNSFHSRSLNPSKRPAITNTPNLLPKNRLLQSGISGIGSSFYLPSLFLYLPSLFLTNGFWCDSCILFASQHRFLNINRFRNHFFFSKQICNFLLIFHDLWSNWS